MKKIIILTFFIMFIFVSGVQAEELTAEGFACDYTADEDEADEMLLFSLSGNEKEAMHSIITCIGNRDTTVRLTQHAVDISRINDVYTWALYEAPEFAYAPSSFRYSYNSKGFVTTMTFSYDYSEDMIEQISEEIKREKNAILAMLDNSMTELEKVMLIHNYIVSNHEYDYTYSVYDIHAFFTRRTGVCSAYAKAMTYLLRAAGVECSYARSDEMNHVWNMVKIDGIWYHVDATWDDPNERVGYCSYEYFLKSDSHFEEYAGHYGWESEYEATSAWYDNYYFEDYKSPLLYYDGEWYGEKGGELYKIAHLKYGGEELVFSSDSGWSYTDIGIYEGSYIFSLRDGIYVYNPKDYAKQRKIASLDDGDKVYSLLIKDNIVYYQAGSNSYDIETIYRMDIAKVVSVCPFEVAWVKYNDGKLSVSYTYDEFYTLPWKIYASAYDEDNTLICIKELQKGQYSVAMPDAKSYSVFIWEGCMPLCDGVTFE